MADTKLTREWVEEELKYYLSCASNPTYNNAQIAEREQWLIRAALCRHYLATEQDARDFELIQQERIKMELRAVAAERENAKLKESVHNWRRQFNKACEDATAAESANRDLQAEIDRLRRAIEHKDSTLRLCRGFAELKVEKAALDRAIAYTGTDTPKETP